MSEPQILKGSPNDLREYSMLKSESERLGEEIETTVRLLRQKQEAINRAQDEQEQVTAALLHESAELDGARADLQEARSRHTELVRENDALKLKVDQTSRDYAQNLHTMDLQKVELAELTEKISKLHGQIGEANKQLLSRRIQADAEESRIATLSARKLDLETSIDTGQAELNRIESESIHVRTELEPLQNKRDRIKADVEGLQSRIQELDPQVKNLEGDLQTLCGQKDQLLTDVATLSQNRQTIEQQVADLQQEVDTLADEKRKTEIVRISDEKRRLESLVVPLQERERRINEAEKRIRKRQRALRKREHSCAEIALREVAVRKEGAKQEREQKRLATHRKELITRVAAMKEEKVSAEHQKRALRRRERAVSKREHECDLLADALQKHEDRLDAKSLRLKQRQDDWEQEIAQLKSQLREVGAGPRTMRPARPTVPPFTLGEFDIVLVREKVSIEGQTVEKVVSSGDASVFEVRGKRGLIVVLEYCVWKNGEREVRPAGVTKPPPPLEQFNRSRLRMGIYACGRWDLIAILRQARVGTKVEGYWANLYIPTMAELNDGAKGDCTQYLKSAGAKSIGTRARLLGDTGRSRDWPCVTFSRSNRKVPIVAYVLTRILPVMNRYSKNR